MILDPGLDGFIQRSQRNALWWHQRRVQLRNGCGVVGVVLFISYDGLQQLGEAVWLGVLCFLLGGPALTVAVARLVSSRRGTQPEAPPPSMSDSHSDANAYVHGCQGRLAHMEARNVRVERGLFGLESLLGWMLLAWVVVGAVVPPDGTLPPLLAMTVLLVLGLVLAEGRRRQLMRAIRVARVELQLALSMTEKHGSAGRV